jgi:anti-anti-sigma regulatory factor
VSFPTVHLPPKVEQSGNVRVITFTTEEIRDVDNVIARELKGCTDGLGRSHLMLDFTNVKLLSTVELGTLLTLHKRIKASGGRLSLFNLNPRVYEVVTAAHVQARLEICREGTTTSAGSGSTEAIITNKVNGSEKRQTGYSGDPDNKYIGVCGADPDKFVCSE